MFRRAHRLEGETANEFAMRLRSLVANCSFTELQSLEANLNGEHGPTEREMCKKGINSLGEESINNVKFNTTQK